MPIVKRYLRQTPLPEQYALLRRVGDFSEWTTISEFSSITINERLDAIEQLDATTNALLRQSIHRIVQLTDDLGQEVLLAACPCVVEHALENAYARSTWIYLNEPKAFHQAEEARFTDYYRQGRYWDGFEGPKDVPIQTTNLGAFDVAVREGLLLEQMKIEAFFRTRHDSDGGERSLFQLMIYRAGLPDSVLVFEQDELVRQTIRQFMKWH